MNWTMLLPQAPELAAVDLSRAREIRLRPGRPLTATLPEGLYVGAHRFSPEEILAAAQALTGYALAGREREMRQGYISLAGGHRLGVCGRMDEGGLTSVYSLCIRVAHEVIGAAEAKEIGLVNDVYAPEELMPKALELANAICANAQIAVQESKRCIRKGMQTDIYTGSAFEAEAFGVTCGTEDKDEGMGAFLEKRKEKNFKNK